jgi:hypothetical protein
MLRRVPASLKSPLGRFFGAAGSRRLLSEAAQLEAQGRLAEARGAYRRAAEASPRSLEAQRGWARAAALTQAWDEAVRAGCAAIGLNPSGGKFYVWTAEAMLRAPPSPRIVAWFDHVSEGTAPAEACHVLGLLNAALGDPERAKLWFRRHCLSGPAVARGGPSDALDLVGCYVEALQAAEDADGEGVLRLVELLMEAGEPLQAGGLAEDLAGRDPSARLQVLRATLDNEAGDFEAAAARLEAIAGPEAADAAPMLDLTRRAMALGVRRPPAIPRRPGPLLQALVSPLDRKRLSPSSLLRRFARADRGDLVRARLLRSDDQAAGWIFPAFCATSDRLTPRARGREEGGFLFDHIPAAVLDGVRAGRGTLMIDHGHEALFAGAGKSDARNLAELAEHLDEARLPRERILILDGDLKSPASPHALDLRILADRHLWLDLAGVFRRLRRQAGGVDERLVRASDTVLSGRRREKAFLSFNHAPRPHRLALAAFLVERGLLERGLVSFHGPAYVRERTKPDLKDRDWVASVERHLRRLTDLEAPRALAERLLLLSPMEVDVDFSGTGATAKALGYGANSAEPYLSTCFSVVTETMFSDGRSSQVTEKVVKPVANLHPFVYLGEPGALAELRARGYRTFSPLIDEAYDDMTEPRARMAAALGEIERLARLAPARLHELYCECWPALVHNYLHFIDGAPAEAERIAGRIALACA